MQFSRSEKALLPLVALQGALATSSGFIGFFTVGAESVRGMFLYVACMLTVAMLASVMANIFGPVLCITGKRLCKMGFLVAGIFYLFGSLSIFMPACAVGIFLGTTWNARHWMEMAVLKDEQRDHYGAFAGACTCAAALIGVVGATVLLGVTRNNSALLYFSYGLLSIGGGLVLCNRLPETDPIRLVDPMSVFRNPAFLKATPLFFCESGLIGIVHAIGATGAVKALGSAASSFGWVGIFSTLVAGATMYLTRKTRSAKTRKKWFGVACFLMILAFACLGGSLWMPLLYVAYSALAAGGRPLLDASEQLLNQQSLDISGDLADKIFAREIVLWVFRIISLGLFYLITQHLSEKQLIVGGACVMMLSLSLEYIVGAIRFRRYGSVPLSMAQAA